MPAARNFTSSAVVVDLINIECYLMTWANWIEGAVTTVHSARLSSASRESPVSFSLLLFLAAKSDFVRSPLVIILALKLMGRGGQFTYTSTHCKKEKMGEVIAQKKDM